MPSKETPKSLRSAGVATVHKPLLLGIPPELQGMVLDYIRSAADLRRLCLVCRQLRHIVLPRLYEDLQLGLPNNRTLVHILEQLVNPGSDGLTYTKSITITDRLPIEDRFDDDISEASDAESSLSDHDPESSQYKRSSQTLAVILNSLIRLVIGKVPKNQLRCFKWRHTLALSPNTIAQCAKRHTDSFCEFGVDYQSLSWNCQSSALRNIRTLELGSLVKKPAYLNPSGAASDPQRFVPGWIGQAIYNNALSLRRLKLGTESCVVKGYLFNEELDVLTQARTLRGLYAHMVGPNQVSRSEVLNSIPMVPLCLTSLHLIGLDVSLIISDDFPRVFKFASLKAFYLESCICSEVLLESLAVSFESRRARSPSSDQAPAIKDFRFRHEESTISLHKALEKFLSSFSGLQALSVLLDRTEAPEGMPHPRCFAHQHGDTLRTLVWEGRTGPRTVLRLDTSFLSNDARGPNQLVYISENCPRLVELGVAIDWRHHYQGIAISIRNLKSLRTFNIRNSPETSVPSPAPLSLNNIARFAAMQIVESTFDTDVADFRKVSWARPCSVKLIAIGAVTYRDVRTAQREDEDDFHDLELHDYLSPRFFFVKHHRDALGDKKPLLTEVGMSTSYGVEAFEPNLKIFEPYWLN